MDVLDFGATWADIALPVMAIFTFPMLGAFWGVAMTVDVIWTGIKWLIMGAEQ